MATVIILDDEPRIRELLQTSIKAEGYEVFSSGSAEEVYAFIDRLTSEHSVGPRDVLLLTDIRMPEVNGLEVIQTLHEKYPDLPIIICSSMLNTPVVEDSYEIWAAENRIVARLEKPIHLPHLLSRINATLDKRA
ncbi:MAG: response regulator [Kiritimatiellae bacterium]|nr:response regulator [Kiritimatiellia bacterium]